MSSPINAQINGEFDTNAVPSMVSISLPPGFTSIKIYNETDIAAAGAGINIVEGKATFNPNTCITYTGAAPVVQAINAVAGLTFIADSAGLPPGPPVVNITSITAANPAVAATITPAAVGQIVRVYSTTGMLQIGGWDFTVTAVTPATDMTFGYLPAGAFAAPATAGSFRVIPFDARYYPVNRRITAISQAAAGVITMSVTHGFTVGQLVRIIVPPNYGMIELNNQLVTITAIDLVNNRITINVNTAGFTPFVFPSSAMAAVGQLVPQVVPVGEAATAPYQNLLDDATRNTSFTGVVIDPAVLIASKHYSWVAYRGTTI